jgi:hypothetical protein
MTTIGAQNILNRHGGTALSVAEALILGELESYEYDQVREIVGPLLLETARIRLQALGRLTPEHIKDASIHKRAAA